MSKQEIVQVVGGALIGLGFLFALVWGAHILKIAFALAA